jgi:hypothetical protein
MLVAAFQVQVRRPAQVGRCLQHGGMADPGVEPDVQDVVFLFKARPPHWAQAFLAGSMKSVRLFEPDVGAVGRKGVDGSAISGSSASAPQSRR